MSLGFGTGNEMSHFRGRGSYANPHSTIALRDIPTNIKQVMRLCRFYYHTDSLLRAIIEKMAEYPITQLVVRSPDGEMSSTAKTKWEMLLDVSLNVREAMKQMNIDKYVFGIACRYMHYPFIRYAVLANGTRYPIASMKDVRIKVNDANGRFHLTGTGRSPQDEYKTPVDFEIEDRKSRSRVGLNFTRFNPLRMSLEYNPASGQEQWYWEPPRSIRQGLQDNVGVILQSTEMKILEAAWKEEPIEVNQDRLWISKADTSPGIWDGWGVPPLFAVLEDVYYYKILRRANEALANEHVTPLRILSPAGSGDVSPQRTMNLADWQRRMRMEMQRFRRDPNHVLLSPVPMNIEQMGGQARVMMVASEIEAAARVIAAGLGCPIEMIWGGLNWSGASVSLRVLENHFLNAREGNLRTLHDITPKLAAYFRLPPIEADMTEFKMADDVQKSSNAINMMLQGFLDRESVLGEEGYDPDAVFERLKAEHKKMNAITMMDNVEASHMNTVIQTMEAKAQVLIKYDLQLFEEAMAARNDRQRTQNIKAYVQSLHEQGVTAPIEFEHSATVLSRLQPDHQQLLLATWAKTMPFVSRLLAERVGQEGMYEQGAADAMGAAQAPQSFGAAEGADIGPGAEGPYAQGDPGFGTDPSPDMVDPGAPLPEQQPPRRDDSPV